jgi:tryptophanase
VAHACATPHTLVAARTSQHDTTQRNTTQRNATQRNATQRNATRHNTTTDFKAEAISGDTKVLNEDGKPVPLPKK